MDVDLKTIGAVMASAIAAGSGGLLTGNNYNKSEHKLEIAEEQSRRDDQQRLFDAQTLAHQHAMTQAQVGYSQSLQAVIESCN